MIEKIKPSHIIYSAVALVTALLIIVLPILAAAGSSALQLNIVEGEVLLQDGTRNEYLVGQDIDSKGISLKVGKKIYSADELEFAVDNQSAGRKMVEVYHRDGNDYYRGYYPATYFAVRHLDMQQWPTSITFDADGNARLQGMVLWADLSDKPTGFPQPDDPTLDKVIILDEGDYTVEVDARDENGGYPAKINCGKLSINVYFVEVYGEMVVVENFNRIAFFTNENGTDEKLALCITGRGGSAEGKMHVSEGFFVYRDANGVNHRYQFDYYMDGGWGSHFHSDDVAIQAMYTDGSETLVVQVDGLMFTTSRSSWCLAILDNPNP